MHTPIAAFAPADRAGGECVTAFGVFGGVLPLHGGLDGGFQRSRLVALVWGDEGLVMPAAGGDEHDFLTSSDEHVREAAMQRFAMVLAAWPAGHVLQAAGTQGNFSLEVLCFYIRAAHQVLNRPPIAPRVYPRADV